MKLKQRPAKIACVCSSGIWLTNYCSEFFFKEITRGALQTIVLGIMIMLVTSCASTSDGVSTRPENPVANNRQATNSKDDSWYQPTRSPEYDPDLLGGE
jgi:hypothetical protein